MRLLVIITLGLGVCGPMLIDAEKIVFVVPRYVRRSYTSSPVPFYKHGEQSHSKIRHFSQGPRRPYFSGHYGSSEPFFTDEKPRVPQSGDDFDQGIFTPKEQVNHVVIPHGKGISHGISFGKGYIPQNELKGGNYQSFEFQAGNGNNLEYAGQNQQEDVDFEDETYSRFQNPQDHGVGGQNVDWNFPTHQSTHQSGNYNDQETFNQEEPRLQFQDAYQNQGTSSATKEELFFPKSNGGEEPRALLEENAPSARISANVASDSGAPVQTVERKLAPIILQDELDMREYVEKVQAFAKNWSPAAALQGFGWKNQILNPPSLNVPNFQGYNSWSSNLPRPTTGSYQVQEDSVEEPTQRSYRTTMM